MKLPRLITYTSPLAILVLFNSCNAQVSKKDFIGKYHIDKFTPIDSTSKTSLKVKQAAKWVISLKGKNNFEFTGSEKNIVGYWRVENNGKEYKLLFQSGRITTYARFDGTNIFFDKQDNLLDSVFSQAIFTKAAK